jgi:hypothetical protein
MSETSESYFFLIDTEGRRRIPFKQRNRTDGRYGYSILPVGKGNDPSAGEYAEDPARLVQRVILDNQLVRAKVVGGKQDGQPNSVGLGRQAIRGYWLAPHLRHFVAGAATQSEELPESVPTVEQDIAGAANLPVDATEREAVIAARRGQGVFRARLDEYWGACAVTACTARALLRASHIRPWRESGNADRLNPDNGLLLAAHLDAAFDQGLISFADDGRILLHARLSAADATTIGITAAMRVRRIRAGHLPFLARHRELHSFAR